MPPHLFLFQSLPNLSIRFAHAETLIPLVCALGLYRDKEPLLPSNYECKQCHCDFCYYIKLILILITAQKKRLFRVADLSPFGGNVALVVYKCQSGEFKILYTQNGVL